MGLFKRSTPKSGTDVETASLSSEAIRERKRDKFIRKLKFFNPSGPSKTVTGKSLQKYDSSTSIYSRSVHSGIIEEPAVVLNEHATSVTQIKCDIECILNENMSAIKEIHSTAVFRLEASVVSCSALIMALDFICSELEWLRFLKIILVLLLVIIFQYINFKSVHEMNKIKNKQTVLVNRKMDELNRLSVTAVCKIDSVSPLVTPRALSRALSPLAVTSNFIRNVPVAATVDNPTIDTPAEDSPSATSLVDSPVTTDKELLVMEANEFDVEKIKEFREALEVNGGVTCYEVEHHIGTFKLSDGDLLRFLRARDFNFEASEHMLRAHLTWRDKYIPANIKPVDVQNGLKQELVVIAGFTKLHMPVLLVRVDQFRPKAFTDVEEFIRYVAFYFEQSVIKMGDECSKGVLLFDLKGFSLKHHWNRIAIAMIKQLVHIIMDHNPERLHKCYLFNAPFAFQIAWKLIQKMLDAKVREKVMFVTSSNMDTLYVEEIDPAVMTVEYGGTRTEPYEIPDEFKFQPQEEQQRTVS